MIPTKTKTTETPAKVAPVAAAMMQAITTITNIMLTQLSISHTPEEAAEILAACTLMDQITGTLRDRIRDQLQPGTYGDAILTVTPRQTRNLLNVRLIRELAAEVPDSDAWRKGDSDFTAHVCRYVTDYLTTCSNESKGANLHMDIYGMRWNS